MPKDYIGKEVEINNKPILDKYGNVLGLKEGCGEIGLIVDVYTENDVEYFVIDMGYGRELHFTHEHFHVIEEHN